MSHIIAPSFLASDFSKIGETVTMINESAAEWFHIDVMDGHFVPNLTFGMPIISALKKDSKKVVDVHLMISNPEQYIEEYITAGADVLTVHYEACDHLHRIVHAIKDQGVKAGVALNPHTPVNVLESIIADLDLVCLMSVNPGFGGQSFIENTYAKTQRLSNIIAASGSNALIEIDGGVNLKNARPLLDSGANVLVAGSTVFKSENPTKTIEALHAV